ncbi:hypothetical protein [Plantactinospora sonchi]|uniref:Uncharacterized protein n=1 Tax=Plantactinospora sonchi TaxID=1544735 RepID=A0ABU7S366_9ACTN
MPDGIVPQPGHGWPAALEDSQGATDPDGTPGSDPGAAGAE